MEQNTTHSNTPQEAGKSGLIKWTLRWFFSFTIPICIVAFALGIYVYQIKTRPKAQRQKPPRQARLVSVETIHKTTYATTISAMGTVVSAREITINPEVTGVITAIDPVVLPGGIIQKGQILYEIDSRDYQTVVRQRQSDVEKAELNLKLESGNQTIAQQEYSMLEEVIQEQDKELVLRKPHLEEARAALEAAKAMLDQAELDVQRCTIRAPFNAVIKEKYADLGARVSPTSPLISAIGVDEFWVEVLVPVDQLRWLDIPQTNENTGSAVHIYNSAAWGEEISREGRVIRLLGQLEEQGRMARVLVAVRDPLGLDRMAPPLLISSFVRVEIQGRLITDVFPIKREYIRSGTQVWLMNKNMKLEIRPAEIVFRSKDTVYIRNGFQEGDQIITTDLSTPVEGMPLRVDHEIPEQPSDVSKTGRKWE
jgi:RND family efflux transporter MFP subunit